MTKEPSDRTLVCLRYGIGDVVMEMPALRALRRHHPQSHFTALGAWPALELVEGDSLFDAVMGIQAFGFQHWGDTGTAEARQHLAQWLQENRFHRVMDACHTVLGIRQVLEEQNLPTFNTGGQLEVDGDSASPGAHSIWCSAVRAWGLPRHTHYAEPRLFISRQATRRARAYFQQRALTDHAAVVGLAPIASSRLKRWPLEHICDFVRQLTTRPDLQILVFGIDPMDSNTISRLEQSASSGSFGSFGSLHCVEPVHLQQTAALIARCHALLANDTGLMHMGAAVGTPTVAVFGPTSPQVVLPMGARAVSSRIPCSYRLENRFGPPQCVLSDHCLVADESCINDVPVKAALDAIVSMLDRPPPHGKPFTQDANP